MKKKVFLIKQTVWKINSVDLRMECRRGCQFFISHSLRNPTKIQTDVHTHTHTRAGGIWMCMLQWCALTQILRSLNTFLLSEKVLYCFVFTQTVSLLCWLSFNSLCRPGWPRTQRSPCHCLLSAGIKGVHCQAGLNQAVLPPDCCQVLCNARLTSEEIQKELFIWALCG